MLCVAAAVAKIATLMHSLTQRNKIRVWKVLPPEIIVEQPEKKLPKIEPKVDLSGTDGSNAIERNEKATPAQEVRSDSDRQSK